MDAKETNGTPQDEGFDRDYALCECALAPLSELVANIEAGRQVRLVKEPTPCLTMVRAADSIEGQEFYLGEALTTECEVELDGHAGYGLCLGEEPERAYRLAVVDALCAAGAPSEVEAFVADQYRRLRRDERTEFNQILRTQVDFKLFDEE